MHLVLQLIEHILQLDLFLSLLFVSIKSFTSFECNLFIFIFVNHSEPSVENTLPADNETGYASVENETVSANSENETVSHAANGTEAEQNNSTNTTKTSPAVGKSVGNGTNVGAIALGLANSRCPHYLAGRIHLNK